MIQDPALFSEIRNLHIALESDTSTLEHESRYLLALAQLVIRHADIPAKTIKRERREITRIRAYIDENFADDIKLADLANLVHWNPFYLLRVFRAELCLPPHAYLETVRIREAQRLLKSGLPIAETAYSVGFSSQSHFTTTFKRLISVTPGQYAK